MTTPVNIAGVCERDVDLLLLEEFQSESGFSQWFVEQTLGEPAGIGDVIAARRSATDSTGESDLEVDFQDGQGGTARMLVENKVGAGLQPRQADRYCERGDAYVARGDCRAYHTVIVAPEAYFGESGSVKGFDYRITYEEILGWFERSETLGARRRYKCILLQSAIDKGTLGYQPEEDTATSAFWRDYWLLATAQAPGLEMPEPGPKPAGAGFIDFRPPVLPAGIRVVHKLNRGCVDLEIRDMGQRVNEVRAALASHLTPDMQIVRTSKSAAVRINVPILSGNTPADEQRDRVLAGIEAAARLLTWSGSLRTDLEAVVGKDR